MCGFKPKKNYNIPNCYSKKINTNYFTPNINYIYIIGKNDKKISCIEISFKVD